MTNRTLNMTDNLYDYLLENGVREAPLLAELRAKTVELPGARMQIAPEQGAFMQLMLRLIGAKQVMEFGTFTGYSALAMAMAMPADAHVLSCDIDPESTSVAREFWQRAGMQDKITLALAPGLETLQARLDAGDAGQFDAVFIAANKRDYLAYFQGALELVRVGGLIMIDNVLWSGKVADAGVSDVQTEAIRACNQHVLNEPRVAISMVPIADGLTLALRIA